MDIYDVRRQLGSGRSIYDIPLRVAYYACVSTDKDEQLHSLSAQVRYYADFIQQNPSWTLVDGYVDEEEAKMVRFIFDQYANFDVGIRTIAQQLT